MQYMCPCSRLGDLPVLLASAYMQEPEREEDFETPPDGLDLDELEPPETAHPAGLEGEEVGGNSRRACRGGWRRLDSGRRSSCCGA